MKEKRVQTKNLKKLILSLESPIKYPNTQVQENLVHKLWEKTLTTLNLVLSNLVNKTMPKFEGCRKTFVESVREKSIESYDIELPWLFDTDNYQIPKENEEYNQKRHFGRLSYGSKK